jgi:ATP-dependent DNA ligase
MEFHGISLSNGYRDRLDASDGCLMCLLLCWKAADRMKLEGIVSKLRDDAPYRPGKRCDW